MKSDKPEIKFKGIMILIAFFAYVIAGFLDAAVETNIFTLFLTRTLFISSMIIFYFGFLTPEWLKKRIIK